MCPQMDGVRASRGRSSSAEHFRSTKPCRYLLPALFHNLSFLLNVPFSVVLDKQRMLSCSGLCFCTVCQSGPEPSRGVTELGMASVCVPLGWVLHFCF